MKNNFIESCINELSFNSSKLASFDLDFSDVDLLLSYPRSGNGWIRYIIALYYVKYVDGLVEIEKESFNTINLKDLTGVSTIGLSVEDGNFLPLDLYLPDIYQYLNVRDSLSADVDNILKTKMPHSIFKTHHLMSCPDSFNSCAAIVRNPYYCAPSAALLLEGDLSKKGKEEVEAVVEYYFGVLVLFFESYLKMKDANNFFLLNLDDPSCGLGEWLGSLTNTPSEVVEERVLDIVSLYPHKSGFDKQVYDLLDVEKLPSYDKSICLYNKLVGK